jgi:hypothetical protein
MNVTWEITVSLNNVTTNGTFDGIGVSNYLKEHLIILTSPYSFMKNG